MWILINNCLSKTNGANKQEKVHLVSWNAQNIKACVLFNKWKCFGIDFIGTILLDSDVSRVFLGELVHISNPWRRLASRKKKTWKVKKEKRKPEKRKPLGARVWAFKPGYWSLKRPGYVTAKSPRKFVKLKTNYRNKLKSRYIKSQLILEQAMFLKSAWCHLNRRNYTLEYLCAMT